MANPEDYVDNHGNSDDGNSNNENYTDEEDNDKKDITAMETRMIYLHMQVCYPSLLVTPQHWSRVPHARFDYFLQFLPTLCVQVQVLD